MPLTFSFRSKQSSIRFRGGISLASSFGSFHSGHRPAEKRIQRIDAGSHRFLSSHLSEFESTSFFIIISVLLGIVDRRSRGINHRSTRERFASNRSQLYRHLWPEIHDRRQSGTDRRSKRANSIRRRGRVDAMFLTQFERGVKIEDSNLHMST